MKCDFVAVLAWLKRCSKWRVVYAVFTFMGHSGLLMLEILSSAFVKVATERILRSCCEEEQ